MPRDKSEADPTTQDFTHVITCASEIVDKGRNKPNLNNNQSLKIEGIDADQLGQLLANYEKRLIVRCEELQGAYNDLLVSPDSDVAVSEISKPIHALKGGGSSFGYDLVTVIAAMAEEHLDKNAPMEPSDVRMIGNCVAAIVLIANKKIPGDGGEAGQILLHGLSKLS